jgi:hypothetical protein
LSVVFERFSVLPPNTELIHTFKSIEVDPLFCTNAATRVFRYTMNFIYNADAEVKLQEG